MPTLTDALTLRTAIASAAQAEYDSWDQGENGWDEELGEGGICHLIADRMVDILSEANFDAVPTHSEGIGENHVWVTAKADDGIMLIDIPPSRYENGSGYRWRKKSGVQFSIDDIVISVIDPDPRNFRLYADVEDEEFDEHDESLPHP
ncbi:hypothetical protein G6L37_02040 [Agrobacterium rubi]|nr:hypothetical protein [Agrobacterium rubi]NTF24174.1 hypothetical protein [Agrobacterium rubi]